MDKGAMLRGWGKAAVHTPVFEALSHRHPPCTKNHKKYFHVFPTAAYLTVPMQSFLGALLT